jgi:ABC-type Fe3+/spermidine/putrescine transport system ATPase subunit
MQVELRALQRRLGVTTVMVTHDQDEALTMADRIVVMRDGRLEQVGTATEIYQRPASTFVATFLGASNLFNGKVESRNGGETLVTTGAGLSLSVDGVAADARDVVVSVRPEAVVVNRLNGSSPPHNVPNTIVAEIEQVIYHGFISHYYLKLQDGQELIAYQQNQTRDVAAAYAQGEKVIVRWDRSSNHVIAKD